MYTRFSRRFSRVFVDFCRNPSVDPNYQRFVKILSDCPNLTRSLYLSNSFYRKVNTVIHCENEMPLNVNYEQLLEAQKDNSILIVDVREPVEIKETGKLPGSIHIPMNDVQNIFLNLSEEEFEKRYGKQKPGKDTKIIFSCRSGKRSKTVQEMIQKLGYTKVYNYTGGWQEWESKQKKK
ncbi:rhodanese domain-containing protein CG4456-like isoform X1 [Cataglyphis hispanica]|uniref:rhodanese domain-containing protein CG4456-like isoform X1 n=1 Tax=Cataglyphis hispanica TaxID=1086592 RepID=UPI002180626D|nr:rhodanese domain-containing protein CG4456-like isoform X1 [Cataglyphis hispanica]